MATAENLLGTWLVESYVHDGREDRRYRSMRVEFGPDKFTIHRPSAGMTEAAYTIEPTASPSGIDFHPPGSAEPACLGVYRLEGDRLTVCHADETVLATGGRRPDGFACPPGSGLRLWLLRRQEPAV